MEEGIAGRSNDGSKVESRPSKKFQCYENGKRGLTNSAGSVI